MDDSLRASFARIKEELDVHLDSINENTNEINANFEHVARLEDKIDKLNERLDEISMMFSSLIGEKPKAEEVKFENIKLTLREQEVFLTLYTSQNELTYYDIARKLGLTPDLVERYIKIMLEKGIPITRKITENKMFLLIDDEFKSIQAKENVLRISENISQVFEQ
jgi:hypothetical protein